MNYLIIEDEAHNAGLLKSLVEKTDPAARLLGILPTVQESTEWLEANPAPDVIFMDIRLADGLSFEIFNRVKIVSPVIFTTAYDEYALQAFKVYGAAYLLKPVEKDELQEALEKVKRLQPKISGDEIGAIMEMFRTREKTYRSRFLLHYRETYKVIPVEEIDYICLEHKNVYFHLLDGTSIAVPYTLEELEEQLDPQFFFRVNRQYILNINSIDSIHKYFNDKLKIVLKRNRQAEVMVSRIRIPQFKLWLDR
ncbi:response regulator [Chryseobacterium sp. SN22]|uniref:LytR/AlgR family response regulator transcription factor n=1 Tax=Chryseobacterium sp. SN22 TaxID=2606431 RepID=UPI0011ED8D80|nr:LytTR family transcriptional regulator DNA-binding domain-containing protein [Chryseobacterium sp. SN22]KAA0129316.1 response regulator [Chryseobacterium sp. SN22]